MTTCKHYWLLGNLIPGQPADQQTCKLCGKSKPFVDPYVDSPYQELAKRTHGRGKEERAPMAYTGRSTEI